MSILAIINNIKQIHDKQVVLVKIGEFYHVYGKDSYILAYLLNYKIKTIEVNNQKNITCGFPSKSLSKVIAFLENKKISYMIVDRRNSYEVDEFEDYKNLNCYEKIFEKAYQEIKLKIIVMIY